MFHYFLLGLWFLWQHQVVYLLHISYYLIITFQSSNFFLVLPDAVLYLCEREHIEGGMIFQLLEDLTEMSTMRNCKDIFGYIESKQDILGKVYAFKLFQIFVYLLIHAMILTRLSNTSPAYSITTNSCVCFDGRFAYSKNFLLVENL